MIRILSIQVKSLYCTFHVSFTLVDDKSIAPAATLLVTHNTDAFNRPVRLELATQVAFGCVLVLFSELVVCSC